MKGGTCFDGVCKIKYRSGQLNTNGPDQYLHNHHNRAECVDKTHPRQNAGHLLEGESSDLDRAVRPRRGSIAIHLDAIPL